MNRNIRLACCALRSSKSPYFSGVVTLLRFLYPLGGEVALPRLLELVPVVALCGLVADPDGVRDNVEGLSRRASWLGVIGFLAFHSAHGLPSIVS